ncbi:hypothetical protein [Corynebacterium pyruviciproducens]|uniref:Uncharacterized protein n=1 Tax=Corynebacterium pyruviciproducens TaxID=598660 RepID=A0AAF0YSJ7_9CORY|nr:hypothetical protein [Corynebacterium pyruviciproducens]WOT03402.1 hypothetical protein CYJ47_06520 [Corynebacterium pyruviciproducens]
MTELEAIAVEIAYQTLERNPVENRLGAGWTEEEIETIKEIYADLQIKLGA